MGLGRKINAMSSSVLNRLKEGGMAISKVGSEIRLFTKFNNLLYSIKLDSMKSGESTSQEIKNIKKKLDNGACSCAKSYTSTDTYDKVPTNGTRELLDISAGDIWIVQDSSSKWYLCTATTYNKILGKWNIVGTELT